EVGHADLDGAGRGVDIPALAGVRAPLRAPGVGHRVRARAAVRQAAGAGAAAGRAGLRCRRRGRCAVSAWEAWTWIAIAVLMFGSVAAFVWFLRDVARLFQHETNGAGSAGHDASGPPSGP